MVLTLTIIATWDMDLENILEGKFLDTVIDSGGGEILQKTNRILKHGGIVVCYGM